jgi:hypothetical protein
MNNQEHFNPDNALNEELIEWLLWDASDETIHYWATQWLNGWDVEELRQMVRDAQPWDST